MTPPLVLFIPRVDNLQSSLSTKFNHEAVQSCDNKIDFENEESSFGKDNRRIQINEPVDCASLINKIKLTLSAAIDYYWKDLSDPELILFSLLDPRIKKLSFISTPKRYTAEDLLRKKYGEIKSIMETGKTETTTINENKQIQRETSTILANLKKPVSSTDEVAEYLYLEEIDLENNPFTWWKKRKEKFPVLCYLAMKYLSVYTSSTVSEKLFSEANNLLTDKEIGMNSELFKYLIF